MRGPVIFLFASACCLSGALLLCAADPDLPVVPQVDLKQYQGKWYEIARLPNRFQRKCSGDVTATYTLQPDKKIKVVNECKTTSGKTTTTDGTAKLRDDDGPAAKLKVTFFWPFAGDYWIVDLDPGYRWALVGTPNRKYFWILSRTPSIDDASYRRFLATAKKLGFASEQIQKTSPHS